MTDQHDKFKKRLKDSSPTVFMVAHYFHRKGWDVNVKALRIAPDAAQHEDYADGGDVLLTKPRLMEVKRKTTTCFTCAADYPWSTMFLGKVESVDRHLAKGEVPAFAIVSADRRTIGLVSSETREHWTKATRRASNNGNVETYYQVPTELVQYKPMEWLDDEEADHA